MSDFNVFEDDREIQQGESTGPEAVATPSGECVGEPAIDNSAGTEAHVGVHSDVNGAFSSVQDTTTADEERHGVVLASLGDCSIGDCDALYDALDCVPWPVHDHPAAHGSSGRSEGRVVEHADDGEDPAPSTGNSADTEVHAADHSESDGALLPDGAGWVCVQEHITELTKVAEEVVPVTKVVHVLVEVPQVQHTVDVPHTPAPSLLSPAVTQPAPGHTDTPDRVVNVPVVKQQQVPSVQKVFKTVEMPQVQYIDRVVDVPVVKQRQMPSVQVVQKLVVQQRHVPSIQKVQRTVEIPQVQHVDRVVDVPVVKQRQVPSVQKV